VSDYAIVVELAEDGGYGAWSPEVLGCVALGATAGEAIAEMHEAIRLHRELLAEQAEQWDAGTAEAMPLRGPCEGTGKGR
jgi:predicted RNase H-like HicB family nuclease